MTTATAQVTAATAQRHLLLNMTANGSSPRLRPHLTLTCI